MYFINCNKDTLIKVMFRHLGLAFSFIVNTLHIHSLQVMYEHWAVSFNCEKQI